MKGLSGGVVLKGILLALLSAASVALISGMARAPGPDVPIPEVDFKAVVRDDQEITTKVHHATWDGNTYFLGTRGKGTVTVSFEKVRKAASTGSGDGNMNDFQITLRSGDVVAVTFENTALFQGVTNFGTYRVHARNIKEITFE
jgi:hypothetical protein